MEDKIPKSFVALLMLTGILVLPSYFGAGTNSLGSTGRAIGCDPDFPLHGRQAEILSYGLEEPRGLAVEATGRHSERVLIADANRRVLLAFSIPPRSYEKPKYPHWCPDGPCEEVDLRGVAVYEGGVLVAEHSRWRISMRGKDLTKPSELY